jgi:hypothetical protein
LPAVGGTAGGGGGGEGGGVRVGAGDARRPSAGQGAGRA